jgi:hypothetical protein
MGTEKMAAEEIIMAAANNSLWGNYCQKRGYEKRLPGRSQTADLLFGFSKYLGAYRIVRSGFSFF